MDSEAEDPAVDTYLGRIREILLCDRALHDKVRPFLVKGWLAGD